MILSFKTLVLYVALLLTGVSAGLFYAWAVSVIPGTQRITDAAYLEVMQSINRAILNPAFFLVFVGPAISLSLASYLHITSGPIFWLLLGAAVIYVVGTFGVTILGNVPLNDQLDILALEELSAEHIEAFRKSYESPWNWYHLIRTAAAVVSFGASLLALFLTQ